jgi:hypothetical protein
VNIEDLSLIEFFPQELCIFFKDLQAWADGDEGKLFKTIVACTTMIAQSGLTIVPSNVMILAKGDPKTIIRLAKEINEKLGVIDKGYIALAVEKTRERL